jgi:ribonuclease HI
MSHKKLIIYTDGGARGNPGHAGIGVVIYQHKNIKTQEHKNNSREFYPLELELVLKWGRYIGETTNNQAEYKALISALEKAAELGAAEVDCFLDSELIVKQLNHEYKVRDEDLAPLFLRVWNLLHNFKKITFKHIPREKNKEADQMVNEAIDRHLES